MDKRLNKKKIICYTVSALTVLSILSSSSVFAEGLSDQDLADYATNQPKLVMEQLIGESDAKLASNTGVKLNDISGHWGKGDIQKLVDLGGIKGYPDGSFKPDRSISNAEFISIIVGSVLKENVDTTGSAGHWAKPSFDVAVSKGVLKDGEIAQNSYDKAMSREDMAVVLTRVSEEVLKEAKVDGSTANKYIRDYSSLDSTHRDYVVQAFMKGLLNGKENNNFKPKDSLTRAEASTVVMRLMDKTLRVTPKEFTVANTDGAFKKVEYPDAWDCVLALGVDNTYTISAADAKELYDITVMDTNGGFGFKFKSVMKGGYVITPAYVKGNKVTQIEGITPSANAHSFVIVNEGKPDFDKLIFYTMKSIIIVDGDPFK